MKIAKKNGSLLDRHELENLIAESAKNTADIEYIAMMTDVELEQPEEVSNDEI